MMMKLLVLDLDETLLFSTEKPLSYQPHFYVEKYCVYMRPYLNEFLNYCRENFLVAVWTSATESYAEAMVEHIFEDSSLIEFVWARSKCTPLYIPMSQNINYQKKLRKLKNKGYELKDVIMIDDSPEKHIHNYGNLIRVSLFEGCQNDKELNLLQRYLALIKNVPNIRAIEKRDWALKI